MSQQASSNFALTPDQINSFNQNGFLIIENFIPSETNTQLRERIKYVVEHEFHPNKNHAVFSTYKQDAKRDLEKYFEDSVDNISFFLEKNANIDPETGELKQDKFSCINKIGHAIHEKDEVFRQFSHQPKLYEIVKTLSHFERPIILQSMVIFKQPFIGGEVIAHHDATFLYNEIEQDQTENPVIGCWFALEDATRDNGCLWVLPGSHKWGCIKRWVRVPSEADPNAHDMKMEPLQPELLQYTTEMNYEHDKYIPVEVKSGTLVVLHGYLLHKSFENTSSKSREAYTLHILDQAKPFAKGQWIQPKRELVNYFEKQNE